eukprot:s4273_g2.t1
MGGEKEPLGMSAADGVGAREGETGCGVGARERVEMGEEKEPQPGRNWVPLGEMAGEKEPGWGRASLDARMADGARAAADDVKEPLLWMHGRVRATWSQWQCGWGEKELLRMSELEKEPLGVSKLECADAVWAHGSRWKSVRRRSFWG